MQVQMPADIRISLSQTGGVSGASPFSGLAKGDVINASVVSVSGSNVTLQMADGTTVSASNVTDAALLPGDQLSLEVRGATGNQLTLGLSMLNGQEVSSQAVQSQGRLMDAGIQPTAQNMTIAHALEQSGGTMTRSTLTAITRALEAFPSLPLETAAFAVANNIPLNAQTVPVLMNWLNGSATIGSMAQELQTLAAEAVPLPSGEQAQPSFTAALMDARPALLSLSRQPGFQSLSNMLSQLPDLPQAEAAIARFAASLPISSESQQIVKNALLDAFVQMAAKTAEQSGLRTQQTISSAGPQALPQQPLQAMRDQGALLSPQAQPADPQQTAAPAVASRLSPQDALANAIQQANTMNAPAVRSAQTAASAPAAASAQLGGFLDTLSRLFLRPDDPAQAAQTGSAMERQTALTGAIQSQAHSLFGADSAIAQRSEQLNTQAQMANNIQSFTYCQIPFQFNEVKNSADLYIFENKKRGSRKGQSYTVLVALDTENMGRVESVLRLTGGQLDIEFRVEDDNVRQFFSRASDELSSYITALPLGSVSVRLIKTPVTPQNAMTVLEQLPTGLSGIDIQI